MSESTPEKKMPGGLQLGLIIGVPVIVFLGVLGFSIQKQNQAPVQLTPDQDLASNTPDNTTEVGRAAVDTTSSTSTASSESFNLETDLSTTQNGSSMKTLADFTPISASTATLHTNRGDITFELYAEQAPLTVTNFLTLAGSGFYDNQKFHRVIDGFMAQTGDPYSKDSTKTGLVGTGGPGYTIADEFDPALIHDTEGVVSMANIGQPNTGGSQFFITFAATPWLDGMHAVFGKVTDDNSLQVLRGIKQDDVIFNIDFK